MERIKLKHLFNSIYANCKRDTKCKYNVRYYDYEVDCTIAYRLYFNGFSLPFDFQVQEESKYGEKLRLIADSAKLNIKATAKCSGNDSFDINKGKKIAKIKAEQKMFDLMKRVFKDYLDWLNKEMAKVNHYKEYFEYMSNHEKKYIESL